MYLYLHGNFDMSGAFDLLGLAMVSEDKQSLFIKYLSYCECCKWYRTVTFFVSNIKYLFSSFFFFPQYMVDRIQGNFALQVYLFVQFILLYVYAFVSSSGCIAFCCCCCCHYCNLWQVLLKKKKRIFIYFLPFYIPRPLTLILKMYLFYFDHHKR